MDGLELNKNRIVYFILEVLEVCLCGVQIDPFGLRSMIWWKRSHGGSG